MLFADRTNNFENNKLTYFGNVGNHRIVFVPAPDAAEKGRIVMDVDVHFIRKISATVMCLGEECEICKRNAKILKENPTGKNDSDYIPKMVRYYSYVYNVTKVVTCVACGSNTTVITPNGDAMCTACQTFMPKGTFKEEPLNKLEIFAFPKAISTQLIDLIQENGGNPEILLKRVISVKIKNVDNRKQYTFALTDEEITVPPLELEPIVSHVTRLTPEEQLLALQGLSIRDIFKKRRGSSKSSIESAFPNELDERLKNLF